MSSGKSIHRPGKLTRPERFLIVLAEGHRATLFNDANERRMLKVRGQRLMISEEEGAGLVSRDLAAWSPPGTLVATDTGRAWIKRQKAPNDPYRIQHGDIAPVPNGTGSLMNLAESPLLWLHRRKDATGRPMIGDAMFAAGERLRADFTFGNMAPRITVNWNAATAGGAGPSRGPADASDSALAARQRVTCALDVVGPELSGILIDVCCFLKRLEEVERDRHWPARSAKIILSLALDRLARHYGYSDVAEGRERRAG